MTELMRISTPLDPALVADLRCGQPVQLSGVLYTARDAAHARMMAALEHIYFYHHLHQIFYCFAYSLQIPV